MTDIMTRDNHDITFSLATGNSTDDLESITDKSVLQEMLEQSEDLEFRRLVRAQLRKLKKGIQENEPVSKPSKTTEPRFIPQSTTNGGGIDLKSAGSNLRKTSTMSASPHSLKTPLTDTNQSGARLSEVKLRSTSVSKGNEDADRTNGFKVEEVVLRSTPRISPCPSSGDKKGKPAYDVTLKHVTATSSSGGSGSGSRSTVASGGLLRNKGNPTPRQALKHFKEMDNEALLRIAGTGDPNDALKRMSRNLNPNTIRDQTLNWCKNRLYSYENVNIEDFSGSWSDGLAFCALANSFFPQAFDYDSLTAEDRGRNFQLAFDTLEREAGVVPLLEVEDMVSTRNPDWKCVFTYVNSIIARMSEIRKEKEEEKTRKSLFLSSED